MLVLLVTAQIKPEHRDAFIEAVLDDARGAVEDEPGCLRFDVIQDQTDRNRLYFYEVYRDEAAIEQHLQAPHFIRWRDATKDWHAQPMVVLRGNNLFPPDARWVEQR